MPYHFIGETPQTFALSPSDYLSVQGLTSAVLAVILTITALVTSNSTLLLLAGGSILLAVGFTLVTSVKTVMAPTQEQEG